ncbi:MAG: hypothetical protein ABL921_04100 [Pirellula sp.]
MNLPISWVAAAGPAKQLFNQTSRLAADSASQLFGTLLQVGPSTTPNGQSAAGSTTSKTSPSNGSSWNQRQESIRDRLSHLLNQARASFGFPVGAASASDYALQVDASEFPKVIGPEPFRSDVEQRILSDEGLLRDLQSLFKDKAYQSPLGLLPSRNTTDASGDSLTIGFSRPAQ